MNIYYWYRFGRSNFSDALKIIHKDYNLADYGLLRFLSFLFFSFFFSFLFSLLIISRFVSFDVPDVSLQSESFEHRYQFMLDHMPINTLLISFYIIIIIIIIVINVLLLCGIFLLCECFVWETSM